MKKRVFLKILISLVVLSSVLLSSLLGVTKAEYFKSLSKKFDFEANPDLALEYYIYDADSTTSTSYAPQTGVYKNSESFQQRVTIGKLAADLETGGIYSGAEWKNDGVNNNNEYTGASIVYQIKIPVDELGYYTLDFAIDITMNGEGQQTETFSLSYDHAIGCEILNHNDGFTFGNNKRLDLWSRNNNKVYIQSTQSNNVSKLLDADGLYQWKTMSPSRMENVSLSFKVEQGDVDNGYVLWMWDFEGLYGPHSYVIDFTDVSVNKVMNLDGTTNTRTSSDPYFLFPQAKQVNNQLLLSLNNPDNANDYDRVPGELEIRGSNARGKTSYSRGRGNFVTEATENSLTLQAETILYGYHDNNTTGASTDDKGWVSHLNSNFPQSTYTNPISFRVPLKNIEYNTTYRVVFDFSVARQGTYEIDANGQANAMNRGFLCSAQYADYAGYGNLFKSGENLFSSYIDSGSANTDINRSVDHHKTNGMALVQYNDKTYQGKPLTKYDEITSLDNINNITVSSVNDTYAIEKIVQNTDAGKYKSTSRNWFNAVQHTEYNGQNKINWLTFYNTSFSFNIKEGVNGVDLNDLYWVWAIDSLLPMSYYRIRLDNVRIEKVVEYASSLNKDGIKIGGVQISQTVHSDNHEANGEDASAKGIFSAFRGQAGTGQNYQSKGFVLNEYTANKVFTNESNIYSPVIDASRFTVSNSAAPYKIELNGFAVCQGGIDKYVYSVDGGNTWQDMTFTGISATSGNLSNAEKSVDQYTSGTTRYTEEMMTNEGYTPSDYDHVTFKDTDALNGNFEGWKLVADLSEYKHEANLDIIIAAVPEADTDLRCEILRIINFNQIKNYRTYTNHFVSDISVRNSSGTVTPLNAAYAEGLDGNENNEFFNRMRGVLVSGGISSAGSGYALRCSYSHAYEDIRTLYSDFPVKTELSLAGWAMVEGGVDKLFWSADFGKTWFECGGTFDTSPPVDENRTQFENQRAWWYDSGTDDTLIDTGAYFEGTGGAQLNTVNMITADLSAYVGQTVDVIFAAKPNESDVYVPVGRIDNVAVYGDGSTDNPNDKSTFYSMITNVWLDGSDTAVTPVKTGVDGKCLNGKDKWNLGFADTAYTIFEPYNVDILQTRKYTNVVQNLQSGGKVTIKGFLTCHDGVSKYKFTLNNGETWMDIQYDGTDTWGSGYLEAAQYSDATFSDADAVNANYAGTGNMLEFNIPAQYEGLVRDLLVVAEGKNGKLYPVLHLTVKITGPKPTSAGTTTYTSFAFHRRDSLNGTVTAAESYKRSDKNWVFMPKVSDDESKINNVRYRFTFPVIEEGLHNLSFNSTLEFFEGTTTTGKTPMVEKKKTGEIYQAWTTSVTQTGKSTSTASMSVPRTHFLVGEPIEVTYNTTVYAYQSGANTGALGEAVICIAKLDESGKELIKYESNIYPHYERVVCIQYGQDKVNTSSTGKSSETLTGTVNLQKDPTDTSDKRSMTESEFRNLLIDKELYTEGAISTKQYATNTDLPAGKYRIYFYNDETIGFGNVVLGYNGTNNKSYSNLLLTDYIDITIHDPNVDIGAFAVHDYGIDNNDVNLATYYNRMGSQIRVNSDASTSARIDDSSNVTSIWTKNAPIGTTSTVNLSYNVTAEDVKRGYVILDWDLTQLYPEAYYRLYMDNIIFKKAG